MVAIPPCCIAARGSLTHGAGRRVVALDCTRHIQATPGGTFPTRRPAAADSAPHDMKRGVSRIRFNLTRPECRTL